MHNLTKPGGGLDLIKECRALGEASDPDFSGSNATVNKVCEEALDYTVVNLVGGFPKLNKVSDAVFHPCSVEMKLTHRSARCLRYCDHREPLSLVAPSEHLPEHRFHPGGTWGAVEFHVRVSFRRMTPTQDSHRPCMLTQIGSSSDVVTSTFGLPSPYTNRPLSKMTGDGARQNGLPDIEYLLANDVSKSMAKRVESSPWQPRGSVSDTLYKQIQRLLRHMLTFCIICFR